MVIFPHLDLFTGIVVIIACMAAFPPKNGELCSFCYFSIIYTNTRPQGKVFEEFTQLLSLA